MELRITKRLFPDCSSIELEGIQFKLFPSLEKQDANPLQRIFIIKVIFSLLLKTQIHITLNYSQRLQQK